MTLEGKTAVVTGGTRGIGRAISAKLAALGARVTAIHLRNRRAAEETARRFRERGHGLRIVRGNVGDPEAVERAFVGVRETSGGLDILICNAALGVLRPVMELDARSWNWTAQRNVGAFLNLVRAAVPLMEGRDGRIVAITSWGARRVLPHYGAMGASKAAIEAMARHLVPELEPKGITINLVCPGVVETDALQGFPDPDDLIRRARDQTPGGRLATPEEVADVVALLCLPEARRIQGHTIVVDGGASLMA